MRKLGSYSYNVAFTNGPPTLTPLSTWHPFFFVKTDPKIITLFKLNFPSYAGWKSHVGGGLHIYVFLPTSIFHTMPGR